PNNYVYPPDPVNDFDLDGNMLMIPMWKLQQMNNDLWVKPWKDLTNRNSSGAQRLGGGLALLTNIVPEGRGVKSAWQVTKLGKFTRATRTVNATHVGPPARAVY